MDSSSKQNTDEKKDLYTKALEKFSVLNEENKNDYAPFMENFLSTLYMCYKELEKRFSVVNSNKITKTSRIEATVLNSVIPISKKEICEILPDVSPTTVENVLGKMIKEGKIARVGTARASRYIKA